MAGEYVNSDPPIPTLLAFLACDSVIHDAETQKKTLVGVFDRALSPNLPAAVTVGLYAKLVEGSGQYTFKIRMVTLKDETPILEIVSPPTNWSEPGSLEFGMNVRGILVQEFVKYEFQLFANDIYVGRALLAVDKIDLPSRPQQ